MKVGVIGAGRVGLVSGLVLFELGHDVSLFDVDPACAARLRTGAMPFFEPDAEAALGAATQSARWRVTDGSEALVDRDVLLIAVPTPVGPDGLYDLGFLREAAEMLRHVRAAAGEQVRWRGIFLRSTVLPGTTQRLLGAPVGRPGADASLACPVGHLPEFLREGSAMADARQPDRVVVGADDPSLYALARALFDGLDTTFFETGIRTAELIKTANNALLSICISFANEIARIAETTDGADAVEVFKAIHLDRRLQGASQAGIVEYLLPGPGFGGSCLAKDLAALAAFGRERQQDASMLEAALRINQSQPGWFAQRIEKASGGLKNRRVLVLGVAFKPDTDDLRGSIALPVIRELASCGAIVRAHDPKAVSSADHVLLTSADAAVVSDDSLRAAFDSSDVVVLITPWSIYLQTLPAWLAARTSPLLFADARGILRETKRATCVTYLGVGAGPAHEV